MKAMGEIIIQWDESKYNGIMCFTKGKAGQIVEALATATVNTLRRIAKEGAFKALLNEYIVYLLKEAEEEVETVTFDIKGGATVDKEAEEPDV